MSGTTGKSNSQRSKQCSRRKKGLNHRSHSGVVKKLERKRQQPETLPSIFVMELELKTEQLYLITEYATQLRHDNEQLHLHSAQLQLLLAHQENQIHELQAKCMRSDLALSICKECVNCTEMQNARLNDLRIRKSEESRLKISVDKPASSQSASTPGSLNPMAAPFVSPSASPPGIVAQS
eukprot:48222_1